MRHDRGVLHRDLKGPNIILGAHGEVFLLDWGMAKIQRELEPSMEHPPVLLDATDSDAETVQGQQLGTPLYMSPEQAGGRVDLIDRRTDVYALGVILFEILTGTFPFSVSHDPPPDEDLPENPHERMVEWNRRKKKRLYHKIQHDPAPSPRQIHGSIPPALAAICLKCLAKPREDRYQTAADLATNVERWLADEPVAVYKDSLFVSSLRFARRRRVLVASVAALFLAALPLLVSLVIVTERSREDLVRSQSKTQDALNKTLAQSNDVKESLQSLVTMVEQELEDLPGTFAVRRQMLVDAAARLERIYERAGFVLDTDPTMMSVWSSTGNVLLSAGRPRRAGEYFEKVAEGSKKWMNQESDSGRAQRIHAGALAKWGEAKFAMGRPAQAEELYRAALALYEKLADSAREDLPVQCELIRAYHLVGEFFLEGKQSAEAEECFRRALAQCLRHEKLRAENSDSRPAKEVSLLLAVSHRSVGKARLFRKDFIETEKALLKAVEILQPLANAPRAGVKVRRHFATCLDLLGELYLRTGKFAAAEKSFLESRSFRGELWNADKASAQVSRDLALSHHWIGLLREAQGRLSEAVDSFFKERQLHETVEKDPENVLILDRIVVSNFNRGRMQVELGDVYGARESLVSGLEIHRRIQHNEKGPSYDPREADFLMALLRLERAQFQSSEAKRYYGEGVLPRGAAKSAVELAFRTILDLHSRHCDDVTHAIEDLEWARVQGKSAELLLHRVAFLARAGKHSAASISAEILAKLGRNDTEVMLQAATAFAYCHLCASSRDFAAKAALSTKWSQIHAKRAMTLLRELDANGVFKSRRIADRLRHHFALQELRKHPEFIALTALLAPS